MIFTSSQNERLLFDNARANLMSTPKLSRTAVEGAVLTSSYLRLIQPLNITGNSFNFPVLYTASGAGLPSRPDEVRLKQQDAFYVAKVFMYIFKATSATDYAYTLKTYPSPITFPNGAQTLYALYNGKLAISIQNNVQVPAYPLSNFLYTPTTQLTGATNTTQDAFDGSVKMPWEPNILFVGFYDTQLVLTLPQAIGGTADANTYCCIDIQGVLAQNVALGAIQ